MPPCVPVRVEPLSLYTRAREREAAIQYGYGCIGERKRERDTCRGAQGKIDSALVLFFCLRAFDVWDRCGGARARAGFRILVLCFDASCCTYSCRVFHEMRTRVCAYGGAVVGSGYCC